MNKVEKYKYTKRNKYSEVVFETEPSYTRSWIFLGPLWLHLEGREAHKRQTLRKCWSSNNYTSMKMRILYF